MLLFVAIFNLFILPAQAASGLDCWRNFAVSGKLAKQSKVEIVNTLADRIIKNPNDLEARKALKKALRFDDLNLAYFLSLYDRKVSGKQAAALQIFEEGKPVEGKTVAYPTAIAPKEILEQLPYADYRALVSSPERYEDVAKKATLWIKKMQAGTGSSMTRSTYLAEIQKIKPEDVRIGAKGTDLYVEVPDPRNPAKQISISLAEAQILQAIYDAKGGKFSEVVLHDLIGSETDASLRKLWTKKSLIDPTKTYEQLVRELKNVHRAPAPTFQAYMPTLDEAGRISFNRQAPGGHALFAVDALRASYLDELLPKSRGPLVSVVGNGEDLSSTPDPAMVGWMIKSKAPIVMVTTEKTPNDLKGGQIALVKKADGTTYATIIEQAQAKESGQQALFEKLGLDVKKGDQIAFFNTNMALFNYDALTPKIKKLVNEIGESEFMKISAPDLISNVKEQKDPDGVVRKYVQLEGAMGSSLLNLDRYWRAHYGEPLVSFINVDKQDRTRFFSPIKSAFDYFMQFHSDLFSLDPKTMRLNHHRPGTLPAVVLKDGGTNDKYYQDVKNVLDSFHGTSLVGLNQLKVDGQITLNNAILRGTVSILNQSAGKFDLSGFLNGHPSFVPFTGGRPILENMTILISKDGQVTRQ